MAGKTKLSTFLSWGKEGIFGFKTEERQGTKLANSVWCKICAKNYDAIIKSPFCKGEIKASVKMFVEGTSNITKYKLDRHLTSKSHEIALLIEREKPTGEGSGLSRPGEGSARVIQPTIVSCVTASAREAFRKLLKTAYELALTPSMPLKHLEVLVKCQKQNGVKLIQGKQDGRTAKEFVYCISEAIVEKVAVILASSNLMSVLSDGSQARKTGSEKDLILTRIERGGLPCYFLISLAKMSDFGGTDAESIKKAIDHSFLKEINISESSFLNCLVGATADGANVNTGTYRGVLTQLKNERPWLITIHCVKHRIEPAVKAAVNIPFIREIESLYNSNYALLKRSGALKAEVKTAAEAIGITYYELPRIEGTRFVSHRYRRFFRLLHMLPALDMAYSNYLNEKKSESVKAKVQNIIKKLRSLNTICRIAAIMGIFQIMQPTSLVFEGEGLMPMMPSPP